MELRQLKPSQHIGISKEVADIRFEIFDLLKTKNITIQQAKMLCTLTAREIEASATEMLLKTTVE